MTLQISFANYGELWQGRYRRISGKYSVFHVSADNDLYLVWRRGYEEWRCRAVPIFEITILVLMINRMKWAVSRSKGGAFIINEYGQVICPAGHDESQLFYVGEISGPLVFRQPDGSSFTLDNDRGLRVGDTWTWPDVGMAYNLSRDNRVYFPLRQGNEIRFIRPARTDWELVRAIRQVRPWGPVRFRVNPYGIVLVKVETPDKGWVSKYVGRINYNKWFPKESV